jgi:LCP family protein required for cell wall assembly
VPTLPDPARAARRRPGAPVGVDPRRFEVPAPDALPRPGDEPPLTAVPGGPEAPAEGEGDGAAPGRGRRVRRRLARAGLVLAVLLVVVAGTGLWYAWKTFRTIERVEVAAVLTPESGSEVNYLIVGTDSRDGLGDDVGNKEVVVGDGVAGQRSDTLVLMRVGKDGNRMLPLPRDLYLPIADTKGSERINTAIQGGPSRLIKTVQQSLSLPVHHYVQIDFAGFLGLVDAVGGVTIEFDAPAFDDKSGLDITTPGPHKLDKDMALAYVRSRAYTRIVDGKPVVDPTADLGRIQRQQTFLRAVMAEVGATRNPITLARIGDAIASNMKIDDALGFGASIGLARKLAGLNPETVDLPVTPTRTKAGADVLLLKQPGATEALDRFR